ncbi:MAG: GNAT family N-acetyltransferase [Candidatus Gracilibacteria bacterium]|nr:GNAT family N-acetyltransferase [Candidatus Gracilibacteria bacterium]
MQEKFPEKTIAWAILLEEKFIGIVSLEDITRKLNAVRMDVAELGYWLDPAFHGKGLMTEAAHAVMQFGFENLDLHKIIAKHFSQNTASGKVIQKLGFRHIGTSRDEAARDGVWMDGEFYELLKKDFSKGLKQNLQQQKTIPGNASKSWQRDCFPTFLAPAGSGMDSFGWRQKNDRAKPKSPLAKRGR